MSASSRRPLLAGFPGFVAVWLGQIVSVLATSMTQFGLTLWIYQKTGSATALGLMQVFFITPFLLLSPIAGAMVDRHNRKLMMMVSDLGAGLSTVVVLILQATGRLQIWHLYGTAVVAGLGNCFQWPAYSAAISVMIPKEQYGRANGLMSLVEVGPGVLAPLLAGALLPVIGLTGIMVFDVITFVTAIAVLLMVHVPQPPAPAPDSHERRSLWREAGYGFKYIVARPSLLGLQMIFFFGNLFAGMGATVLAPMVLARTGQNAAALGAVQTAGAIGGVLGGVLMSLWGGFKRKVHGVLGGWFMASLFGTTLLGLGRGLWVWLPAMVFTALFSPLIDGSNQAIWQAKVPPAVQGRVFSARRLIAWFTNPLAPLLAGLLADRALEPALQPGGILAPWLGGLVGVGPGAGMALLLVGAGLGAALAGLSGYLIPVIRNAETLLPDHGIVPGEPAPV